MKKLIIATSLALFLYISLIGQIDLENELVGYWSFDDGTAIDNSGNGHNGTIHGSVPFSDGDHGKFITFNGNYNNYVQIPHHSDLNFSDSFSISVWIKKLGAGTGSAHVISKGRDMESTYYLYSGGRAFSFTYGNSWGGPRSSVGISEDDFPLNIWHNVTIIVDNDSQILNYYLNNVLMSQDTIDQSFNITTGHPLIFGRHFTYASGGSSWPYPCHASIDEVRIYSRVLNEDEIYFLYHGEAPTPVTLSSFTAIQTTDNFAQINWTTQSESELIGYNIYRNNNNNLQSAAQVNPFIIEGANTTEEQNYTFMDSNVNFEETYYYWLESIEMDNETTNFGPITLTIESSEIEELPEITILHAAYPNPFKPETKIRFSIKENETAVFTIYNVKGQQIVSEYYEAGTHEYNWNGKNYSSGIYFYKLQTDRYSQIKKMLMLR